MLNVYLSGEIHTDWREEIIQLCKKEDLNIKFSSLLRIMMLPIIVELKFLEMRKNF